ncbi:MAG: HpcH/HpaI aldolase/citrate lyase family protein [Muribaculum sp.]|nr:HpcH/HpaI aldolase/citrate lyase family protein [Muribaculum sp.]
MKHLNLMILCDDAESAVAAQNAGVDRIFYDLEYIGKAERQHGRNTVKSNNSVDNLPALRNIVTTSELLVRTNPIHAYSQEEIDKAIKYGADILMLPMTIDQHDAEQYVKMVGGRAKVCIMIETAAAMARLDKILAVPGVDEVFIGLNDLHISMGLTFMFELLSDGLVEYIAEKCNKADMPFGFGGIARIGEGDLPSDNILGEHVRLGSTSVILSRTFKGIQGVDANAHKINLKEEVDKVRNRMSEISSWTEIQHTENKKKISSAVDKIVTRIQG